MSNPKKPSYVTEDKEVLFARALFTQFRVEQAKKDRYGCMCPECENDMVVAFKRLMNDVGK